jgi:hypothetical protein
MTKREDMEKAITLYTVASIKAHDYAQEYDPNSGRVQDKEGYHFLKAGFMDGFIAGFAHKMGGGHAS